jgi:hypothetical protein
MQVIGYNIKIGHDFLHITLNSESFNPSIVRRSIVRDTFNVDLSIFAMHMCSALDLPAVAGWSTVHHAHPAVGVLAVEPVGTPCCCLQLSASCKLFGVVVGVEAWGGTVGGGAALGDQGMAPRCCGSLRRPHRPHLQLVPGTPVEMCHPHPEISSRRIV